MKDIDALMQRDRFVQSTWKMADEVLATCLREGAPERALPVVEWLRSESWIGGSASDYYPLAAAVYARCGKIEEAVALVRQAFRFGYEGLWRFDGAYSMGWHFDSASQRWLDSAGKDPHLDDTHNIYAKHLYLQPLYGNAEIDAMVSAYGRAHTASYQPDLERTPLCWLEATTLSRKNARCEISGERLSKGEGVMAFRYFASGRGLPTVPLVARSQVFAESPAAQDSAARYRDDSRALADFAFNRRHEHPAINAALFDPSTFRIDAALELIGSAEERATPYYRVSVNGAYSPGSDPAIGHGANRSLIDFLWILVKSGHLDTILARLSELPRHFALTLMLFERGALRTRVAEALGMPGLVEIYAILGKPRVSVEDIATLARFGRMHPQFPELLAKSLRIYEYHLYSGYSPSPNWFFQDFRYLARARGAYLVYALAGNPGLLTPMAIMLAQRCMISGGASAADIEYCDMEPFLYGTVLLHTALTRSADFEFWRALPDTHKRWKDLAKERTRILKVATLV